MALRADTARHIITGATVLIFSAAAIGTAMRYQGGSPLKPPGQDAELPAADAGAGAAPGAPAPMRFTDGARGIGRDIGIQLEGTSALAGSATLWPFRDGRGPAAAAGNAAWWGRTESRLTPTSRGSGGGGGGGMGGGPGSGYAVSGGAKGKAAAPAANGPKAPNKGGGSNKANGGGGGSSSGGGSSDDDDDSLFDEHEPSVGDLIDDAISDDLVGGIPGTGVIGGGDLSHTPEPASLLLMATGIAGVIGAARRRQARRR